MFFSGHFLLASDCGAFGSYRGCRAHFRMAFAPQVSFVTNGSELPIQKKGQAAPDLLFL
jgi:hypothetical protein